jgi:hypothetical protein
LSIPTRISVKLLFLLCGIVATNAVASGTRAAIASTPDPRSLLRHAARVLDRTDDFHVNVRLMYVQASGRRDLWVNGDCHLTGNWGPKGREAQQGLTARTLVHGTSQNTKGPAQLIKAAYVVMARGRMGSIWERSTRTHGVWVRKPVEQNLMVASEAWESCTHAGTASIEQPINVPQHYVTVGRTTVSGHDIWHVRETATSNVEHWIFDSYIDAGSFETVRFITSVTVPVVSNPGKAPSVEHDVTDIRFSRFQQPIRVTTPKTRHARVPHA